MRSRFRDARRTPFARARGAGGAAATPLSIAIANGGGLVQWHETEFAVLGGGGTTFTTLVDQSGLGHDYTGQGAPTVGTPLDGKPTLVCNGTTQFFDNTSYVLTVPGTTSQWVCGIAAIDTWAASKALVCSVTGFVQEVFCNTASPQMRCNATTNGTLNATGLVVGQPCYFEFYFNNSTSSYLTIRNVQTTVPGINPGNSGGGGGTRWFRDSNVQFTQGRFWGAIRIAGRLPGGPEIAAYRSYWQGRYPSANYA